MEGGGEREWEERARRRGEKSPAWPEPLLFTRGGKWRPGDGHFSWLRFLEGAAGFRTLHNAPPPPLFICRLISESMCCVASKSRGQLEVFKQRTLC